VTATTTPACANSVVTPAAPSGPALKTYIAVFLVALLARGGWGLVRNAGAGETAALEFPDERQYWLMASSLRAGEGLKDEFGFRASRMPLYPGALSLVPQSPRGIFIARVALWVMGALAAVLAAATASSMFGIYVGLVAGILVALDPFLIFFSSLLLTETPTVVATLALWCVCVPIVNRPKRDVSALRWGAVGIASALCVYVRESCLGLVVLLVVTICICRGFERRTLLGVCVVIMIVVAALFPWALRNKRVTGQWCWLTSRAGVSLYDGVGPQADGSSNLAEIQSAFNKTDAKSRSEMQWNRYLLSESARMIRDDPGRIARLAVVKWLRTWSPVPNVASYQSALVRAVSLLWTIPIFALAIAGAALLPRIRNDGGVRAAFFLLLPALYISAVHAVFVGSVRYRIAAVPALEILAAVAVFALIRCGLGRRPVWGPGD